MNINDILTGTGLLALIGIAISIGVYKGKIDNNSKSINDIGSKIDKLIEKTEGLSVIKTFIDNLVSSKGLAYYGSNSPIELNDKGKSISHTINAQSIITKYYDKLSGLVEGQSPKNPYDIQQACFTVCEDILTKGLLSEEEIDSIKNYAFEIGESANGFYSIFAIELRNKILKEKGHDRKEIDDHYPNNKEYATREQ